MAIGIKLKTKSVKELMRDIQNNLRAYFRVCICKIRLSLLLQLIKSKLLRIILHHFVHFINNKRTMFIVHNTDLAR